MNIEIRIDKEIEIKKSIANFFISNFVYKLITDDKDEYREEILDCSVRNSVNSQKVFATFKEKENILVFLYEKMKIQDKLASGLKIEDDCIISILKEAREQAKQEREKIINRRKELIKNILNNKEKIKFIMLNNEYQGDYFALDYDYETSKAITEELSKRFININCLDFESYLLQNKVNELYLSEIIEICKNDIIARKNKRIEYLQKELNRMKKIISDDSKLAEQIFTDTIKVDEFDYFSNHTDDCDDCFNILVIKKEYAYEVKDIAETFIAKSEYKEYHYRRANKEALKKLIELHKDIFENEKNKIQNRILEIEKEIEDLNKEEK